jgi:transcription antitermination factor nusB
MTQRELRDQIFKVLFEYELTNNDINQRKIEVLENMDISASKRIFFEKYVDGVVLNDQKIKEEIKNKIKGWSFLNLGTTEKVILKMAFYEILIDGVGEEIAINEAIELSKVYGDENTKNFINGILADLVRNK